MIVIIKLISDDNIGRTMLSYVSRKKKFLNTKDKKKKTKARFDGTGEEKTNSRTTRFFFFFFFLFLFLSNQPLSHGNDLFMKNVNSKSDTV